MTQENRGPSPSADIRPIPIPETITLPNGRRSMGIESQTVYGDNKLFRWFGNISVPSHRPAEQRHRELAIILVKWKLIAGIDAALGFPISAKKSKAHNEPVVAPNANVIGLYIDVNADLSEGKHLHMPKWKDVSKIPTAMQTLESALKNTPRI